ncbi:hypothetical protein AB0I28_12400 [Phytomonospora sp. NPDC050363]|uniref:hypothetical protein n=1 Tax=Phytomonospora sp. NPDC050363 TaxID=3155642 RepID=UPI0033F43EC1
MSPELKNLLSQYAADKSVAVSALIDLVASARQLNPDLSDQEFVTVVTDVFFPIVHQALNGEVSLCGSGQRSRSSGALSGSRPSRGTPDWS